MIRLQDVSFAFSSAGSSDALSRVSLTVRDGEWIAVAGGNGSGKTTLCRIIAGVARPLGGTVTVNDMENAFVKGAPCIPPATGIAFQNPDSQFVTTSVERELLFGMENLGFESSEMKRRCVAAARLFGLEQHLERNPHTLSGGEKQRTILGCLWALGPRHLVLDEPFSFLDSGARSAFLEALRGTFRREGRSVVWSTVDSREMELADRVVFLADGRVSFDGAPGDLARSIPPDELDAALVCPGEKPGSGAGASFRESRSGGPPAVDMRGAVLSPGPAGFVLRVPRLSIGAGERVGVCGPSGSGKTTLLLACAGLLPPREGDVAVLGARIKSRRDFPAGKIAFLFQCPEEGFFAPTVREEIALAHRSFVGKGEEAASVADAIAGVGLSPGRFLERNPFRLSQGEKRLVSLASMLVIDAPLVCLDEPTIFLDGGARRSVVSALERLSARGATTVIASHDAAFLRECTDRIVTLENGALV